MSVQPPGAMHAALDRLRFAVRTLPGVLAGFSETEAGERPSPERWAKKETEAGCVCRHLEYDQHPEAHVYLVAQKLENDIPTADDRVRLRPVEAGDLPRMYDLQLDPESNRMAVTIPRTREEFNSHWGKTLDDPKNTTRTILFDGAFVGSISCFPMDGQDHVGYWIDRTFWGKGIASRALQLLLQEFTKRPLIATAATSNGASLRILQKCGFVVEQVRHDPVTDRYPECEVAVHVLR